ncbi:uncharacterized protein DS421_2g41520 [Arachis hypogaea]|nr:uncharacterized protein DS421_2g41520 [Arachis hypogaea]
MSTGNTPQASYEEVASMEHIRGLIVEARGDNPERISVAERLRQERWAADNADEVARLISNTRGRGADGTLNLFKFAFFSFPYVHNCGTPVPHGCIQLNTKEPFFLFAVDEMVPDRDWSKVAVWRSRQAGIVHRFFVLIPPERHTGALSAVGRFSTDPHIAREDGASEMIRLLLEISGKHLDDYNYDLLDESLAVNYDLQWEIGAVKSSYRELRSSYRYVLRCNNPELVESDSNSS